MPNPAMRSQFEGKFSCEVLPSSKDKLVAALRTNYDNQTPIDVTKSSVIRLLNWARSRNAEDCTISNATDRHNACVYWDGYMRAIEHILEMEDK